MISGYGASILGLLVLCALPLLLAGVSGPVKGKAGLSGGPVIGRGEESFAFRLDRAQMNNVESLTSFAVPAVLAMLVGVGAGFLAWLVWLQVALRLAHAGVYLAGGAVARGGNLRTVFFVLGLVVTLVLIVATALNLPG
ncbi:MAG: MAPEG family protein [Rhodobacteraceae bacterium]|nr:MAPEG family protein [Paracoccaceae bacterium]